MDNNDYIDVDTISIRQIFNSVDLSISSSKGMYSNEYKTQDYISNLYDEVNRSIVLFNAMKSVALRYGLNVETKPEPNPPIIGVVNNNVSRSLNVRDGAGINNNSIEKLKRDDKVTVLENDTNSEWVQIKTESGNTGYVRRDYLDIKDEEETKL